MIFQSIFLSQGNPAETAKAPFLLPGFATKNWETLSSWNGSKFGVRDYSEGWALAGPSCCHSSLARVYAPGPLSFQENQPKCRWFTWCRPSLKVPPFMLNIGACLRNFHVIGSRTFCPPRTWIRFGRESTPPPRGELATITALVQQLWTYFPSLSP